MNTHQFLQAAEDRINKIEEDKSVLVRMSLPSLKEDFGIYDNYRILLNVKSDELKRILDSSGSFIYEKTTNPSRPTHIFKYEPGIIKAQLFGGIWYSPWEANYEEIKKVYDSTLSLHPYQEKDMSDIKVDEIRPLGNNKCSTAIIRSIRDLTKILEDHKIAYCLPSSSKSYSGMIKYFPQ